MCGYRNTDVPLFYDEELLNKGVKKYVNWDWEAYPHLLTGGATGSGKTYANSIIAARVSKHENAVLYIIDMKSQDYAFARGSKNLYEYNDAYKGLETCYEDFISKLEGHNHDTTFTLIIIEELSSLLGILQKKEKEKAINMISQLVFLGRSKNTHLLISSQRPDSNMFGAGVRDSLNAVLWVGGGLSPQVKKMIADGFEDKLYMGKSRGQGFFILNSFHIYDIIVPKVQDMTKLQNYIIEALNR